MEHPNAVVNTLPAQIIQGIEEGGVDYNILVAGEGFSGKSSLIQSLFGVQLFPERNEGFFHEVCDMACTSNPLAELLETTASVMPERTNITLTATKTVLIHGSVRLNLTIYEATSLGDTFASEGDWIPIRNLILNRYEEYHMEEDLGVTERDKRIHGCLYLSTPRHTPREIDLVAMKEIGKICNLIPIISKADMLQEAEYKEMKESFVSALSDRRVQLFDCILIDECKKVVELNFMPLRYSTPDRLYSYSTLPTTDTDVAVLRDLLIKSHAIALVEMTEKYYESYRRHKVIVEVLTASDSGLDENFRREIKLEESKLKSISKRIEEKKKTYQLLLSQAAQEALPVSRGSPLTRGSSFIRESSLTREGGGTGTG
ncbi:hypothetical protein NEDG_00420 [Nematocida displodere]|uniref:Septin-type G domain-containing protein n=1 Tax=Nematocida displodere TaxID=1805483 RepID=A0A177EJ11_9MICR|nr:hypothetical protein NEDG_00420 [Nematocida displodere]